MMTRVLIGLVLVSTLLGCSGGGGDAVDALADTASGENTSGVATRSIAPSNSSVGIATYDANTGVFSLNVNGVDTDMMRLPGADYRSMLAMRDATGIHNAYFGQGRGTEVVVYSGGLAGSVVHFGTFGRTGATDLPLAGQAQFNGDYAGFTSTRRINGSARLDVDFNASRVSGRITDRIFRQRPDNIADVVNPLSDLILEESALGPDGRFIGRTGGGQIVNGQILWNPATGSYTGLIGGATADEAVGTVSVRHISPGGGSFDEVGGFLATR